MPSTLRRKLATGLFLLLVLSFENHLALAATPYQFVKVQNRQLLVDFDRDGTYTPFLIKGAAYSPTPIGRYSDDWGYPSPADPRPKNLYDDPAVLNRDFGLLKAMNANVVRFWKGNNTQVTLADVQNPLSPWYQHYSSISRFPNYLTTKTFDMAQSYGIKIIAGFEMPWPGTWQCDQNASAVRYQLGVDFTNSYVRNEIINRFRTYVLTFKDQPALLFWAIGNENNLGFNDQTPQGRAQIQAYYSLIQTMAQEARLIEGPFYHPIAIVEGDILAIGRADYGSTDANLSNIDIWGSNVYRGTTFSNLFSTFTAKSNKALWISEFGEDAWTVTNLQHPENGYGNQAVQATRDGALWNEIKTAYLNQQSIGATVMAYSDEWWKPYAWLCEIDNDPTTTANGPGGCNLTQNIFGFGPADHSCPADGTIDWTPPAADQFFNEEWWGIMAISKDSRPGYPDIMTPRQVYTTFQQLFFDDTFSPTTTITAPENNSVVMGTAVTVSANATDNTSVVGVQFKLDGTNWGPEDVSAPYSTVWNTTATTDGTHTLTAVARDAQGNLGTATATVTVANITPPSPPVLTSAVAGDAKVVLNWSNTPTAFAYTIKFGTITGVYPYYYDIGNVKTMTVSGLINGATYYFVVVAKYIGTTSQDSNQLNTALAAPDFVITALSSAATIQLGNPLVINSTVKNDSAVSGSTFLTSYYLSYDHQVTPSDIFLGTRTIPALAAGASSTASISLNIPSNIAPVTYYLGAIADYTSFRPEQNESNNAFLGNTVSLAPGADLLITALNGPANGLAGTTVTLNDTIKNQGISAVGASYITYYLSNDTEIKANDIFLGNRYVSGLAAGASVSGSMNVTIPVRLPVGTYYWGAVTDSTLSQAESNENNNATAGNAITLTTNADLIMTAISGPASSAIGQTVTVTDTVKNQGTMSIGASYVGYYLSSDAMITTSDILVGVRYVANLVAGASSSGSGNVAIPAGLSGTYYWGTIADFTQSQSEADETNNAKTGNTIVITPGADLIMLSISGPTAGVKGSTVNLTDTVKNQGVGSIGASYVGYYLSTDSVITQSDTLVGSRYIANLGAGASNSGSINAVIPSALATGTYYWGAIADFTQSQTEADENNNAKAANTIIVTPGADLIMTSISGPANGTKGTTVTLNDTVKNQGVGSIGASYVGYYLSIDSTITATDIRVGARYVRNLAAGASNSGSANVTIPLTLTTGTYYWGAIADFTQSQTEADENNNNLPGNTINVAASAPFRVKNID